MVRGAVVARDGQPGGQDVRIVRQPDSRTARSAASKPIFECVLSQNGFVVDAPQRQSTIESSFVWCVRSYSLPSASMTRTGPLTRYGPFSRTLISTTSLTTRV